MIYIYIYLLWSHRMKFHVSKGWPWYWELSVSITSYYHFIDKNNYKQPTRSGYWWFFDSRHDRTYPTDPSPTRFCHFYSRVIFWLSSSSWFFVLLVSFFRLQKIIMFNWIFGSSKIDCLHQWYIKWETFILVRNNNKKLTINNKSPY